MNLTDVNMNKNSRRTSATSSSSSSSLILSQQVDVLCTLPEFGDGCMDLNSECERVSKNNGIINDGSSGTELNLKQFLKLIDLESVQHVFENEHVTFEILSEMNHKELKEIGVDAYGHRHKIIKGIEKYYRKCIYF